MKEGEGEQQSGHGDSGMLKGLRYAGRNRDGGDECAVVCNAEHGSALRSGRGLSLRDGAQPEDAAFGLQARHSELFHVKHAYVRR